MNGDSYSSRDRRGRDYPPRGGDRDERRERHRDRGDRDRRRSRSPDHRHRRAEGDDNAYSSSRNHRDREREDRYSGRDRRPEREWDRDRGSSRRDARRDDDDRFGRRDRDPYDDRRRGGRDNRRDDGFGHGHGPGRQEQRREASPPPKKREPTPDLTDVVPILERKRRLTQWDIKPPGYEHVTAEQAKLSGMFPLPGAPRQQPMDPSKLQAFTQQSGEVSSDNLMASNSRQAKRLIVSNVPAGTVEDSLIGFFNLQMNGLNVVESNDPCTLCQFSNDRSFAVVEFKTAADATLAFALDGISMTGGAAANGEANGSASGLQIRRPKDYVVPAVSDATPQDSDVVSSVVPDSANKLSITNIPAYLTEEQVSELVASFGRPKAFVLVKDKATEESRGIAFLEYVNPAEANQPALETLNGMTFGEQNLKVSKASIGPTQIANFDTGVAAISGLAAQAGNDADHTRILQLLNMVTPEELMDNDEYEEIREDVKEECSKFGTVLDIKVPRPAGGSRQIAGVGKIFVKFDTPESTTKALQALAGRKFADRTVVATYFPEENFDVGAW
ncbi:Splicing factor U2AF 50 kDa subunit-like protein [Emericellopsis cladophorae]|uniref:Splicing factor U2AF subunit n=1 Tax=Emericellopsis cladophorae TaxID=2686198 RepID=A0A9P9Y552_9HYPO|nr:Splicing factor U2AF 50 kDa subunit-like protein [Emericellopsis cladophorae]KAI6783763.1 Splicing factor U2AF 50 kDa subunit-like protein [Emericellopsis cladophorae]